MKACIIGFGNIGKVHYEVLRELGADIAAVCDVDGAKLSSLTCKTFADYKAMLEEVPCDVCHICTPHHLHTEMILFALDRGVNVLCEKPMCIRREDISKILQAEERSSGILGICQQNRYNEANVFAKEYLQGKKISAAHGQTVWHRNARYYDSADWRGKKATEGGGVLINQALHTLDLLQWMAGEPSVCTATISNLSLAGKIETEDSVTAVYAGETPLTFFATNASAADFPVQLQFRTEDGETVTVTPTSVTTKDGVRFFEDKKIYGKRTYGAGHFSLFREFYRCVAAGKRFGIDGKEAAKVMRMIFAAYESNGAKVPV